MNFIWLGLSILGLHFLNKYEDKIGRNSTLYFILLFGLLLLIGIISWSILGFNSGSGGSPYGEYMFNE